MPRDFIAKDSEKVLCGAVLMDESVFAQIISEIDSSYFQTPLYRFVIKAMENLFEGKVEIDPVTVSEEVKRLGFDLEHAGGIVVISNLSYGLPRFKDVTKYIESVKKAKQKLDLDRACNQIQKNINDNDVVEFAQSKINEICVNETKQGFTEIGEVAVRSVQNKLDFINGEKPTDLVKTGYTAFDVLTGGVNKTDLIIIGGRPGQGKSSLILGMQDKMTESDNEAVIASFSLEMSKEQMTVRQMCSRAKIDLTRYRTGVLSGTELERLSLSSANFTERKIFIDDSSSISAMQMRSRLMMLKAQQKRLDAVFVDYLQRMKASVPTQSRQQEVGTIARELKSLAKDLETPVFCVCSLSRANEARADPRPKLSDLRDSGDIDYEADVAMFVFREHYYNDTADPTRAELIIDKSRHSPTGTVTLDWLSEYTRFENAQL